MSKLQLKIQNYLIIAILFLLPYFFIKFKYNWLSLNLVEALIITLFLIWVFNRNTKYPLDSLRNSKRAGQIQDTRYKNYAFAIALIIIGLLLSILVNKNYYVGFGIIKGWFVLPIIFAIILYDCLKKYDGLLNKIFIALFTSGTLISIEGIYYWLLGILTYDGRLRIFFDSPNQLAMFLAPIFLIGLKFGFEELRARARKEKAELWKLMGIALGLIFILFNLYLTKSYGAWVAVGLALAIVFWLKYSKNSQRAGLVILFIILLVFLGWMGISKHKNIERLGDRSSLASRMMIWKSAGLMLKNNPLFGIGPGNFQGKYLEYQKYFPPYLEWAVPQPHNLFLAFWLEAGLVGLIGFIMLLVQFFRDNKKVYPLTKIGEFDEPLPDKIKKQTGKSLTGKNDFGGGAIHLYGNLCLVIMLYFLIHGLIDTTYWRNDMAILFWVVIAANFYLAGSLGSASRCSG